LNLNILISRFVVSGLFSNQFDITHIIHSDHLDGFNSSSINILYEQESEYNSAHSDSLHSFVLCTPNDQSSLIQEEIGIVLGDSLKHLSILNDSRCFSTVSTPRVMKYLNLTSHHIYSVPFSPLLKIHSTVQKFVASIETFQNKSSVSVSTQPSISFRGGMIQPSYSILVIEFDRYPLDKATIMVSIVADLERDSEDTIFDSHELKKYSNWIQLRNTIFNRTISISICSLIEGIDYFVDRMHVTVRNSWLMSASRSCLVRLVERTAREAYVNKLSISSEANTLNFEARGTLRRVISKIVNL